MRIKMKPIHVLLCFTLWGLVDASTETVCAGLPDVENADILDSSLKSNYTEGDLLHFTCRVGYVSSRRITYKCESQRWRISRLTKCLPKECELPEDTANGRYDIVNGTDFVFGTVIKYTCNEGYKLVGRSDTRSCMSDGWSDHVPYCEVVKCWAEMNYDNMIVNGLEDDSSIRYGHVLHFKCVSSEVKLNGESEVVCLSNGTWSSPFPTCEGTELVTPQMTSPKGPTPKSTYSCGPPPSIQYADITGLQQEIYRHGQKVEYQCKRHYILQGPNSISCYSGEWEQSPTCLEPCIITIEEMKKRGIKLKYGTERKLYVEHNQRVQFSCLYGKIPDSSSFKQFCDNGKMIVPSCH